MLAHAQGETASRISILTDLINAIGAAGDAISKLTAGIKDLVIAGNDAYKYVSAKRERDRLIRLSQKFIILMAAKNAPVVESLDEYIAQRHPTQKDWSKVVQNVNSTLLSVQELLTDVQHEDSSFVLEPAFLTLNQALTSRTSLLSKLADMPAPTTNEALGLLRQASAKYKVLIANTKEAVAQLNIYIKTAAK